MAFKGTPRRTQEQLETEIENMGAHLNAYTSREQTVFYAKCFKQDVGQSMDLIADVLQNSNFDPAAIDRERDTILREMESVNENLEEVIFDKLHETSFRDHPLGRTILGPEENILKISRDDILDYVKTHYVGSRIVVAAAGAVDHNEVVERTKELFSAIPQYTQGTPAFMAPAVFTGSDVRMVFDDMKWCHFALSFPTAGWNDPDNIPLMLIQTMIGSWDRSSTAGSGLHSSSVLVAETANCDLAEKFHTFNTQYSDTGLFGIYGQVEPLRAAHFGEIAMREMARFGYERQEGRLEEAKNQLKMSILAHLEGTTSTCEDIGRQMITYNRRLHPLEFMARIDAVDPKAIQACARRFFNDRDHSMAAIGVVHEVPEYIWFRDSSWWKRA
jgi:processing peptidase subunit beta